MSRRSSRSCGSRTAPTTTGACSRCWRCSGGKPTAKRRLAPWRRLLSAARLGLSMKGAHMEPGLTLDLDALETSFDAVAPRGDELMDVFYRRLFETAPAVRPLFPPDMRKQKTMLLGALVLLRKSLRDLEAIVPKLRELGAR